MHSVRQENLNLSSSLALQTDHCRVLQHRLTTVKEKYQSVKLQRNQAYTKIKELTQANKVLDKGLRALQLKRAEVALL